MRFFRVFGGVFPGVEGRAVVCAVGVLLPYIGSNAPVCQCVMRFLLPAMLPRGRKMGFSVVVHWGLS